MLVENGAAHDNAGEFLRNSAFRRGRDIESLFEAQDKVAMPLWNRALNSGEVEVFVGIRRRRRGEYIHAIGAAIDMGVDPAKLDLELFGVELCRAKYAEAAGAAHSGDDISAMGESDDRMIDANTFAKWRCHAGCLAGADPSSDFDGPVG